MRPRAVLAAIDFSDTSRTALVLAARLARHCGAALHVLHAEEPLLAAAAAHSGLDLARETREELERFVAAAWPAAELTPRHHVVTGPAVESILETAHRERADLLVVGSRGMSGAARFVFGSTAEGVLRRADLSVLVAPPGWAPPRPDVPDLTGTGPIVVAIDFSPSSLHAAAAACELAEVLGSSIELIHVVSELRVPARWRAAAESAARDRIAAAQEELAKVARGLACGMPIQMRVEHGAVASCLADAAMPGATRAPLLVLGRRSAGPTGAAPGATAYRVLTLANVPVVMHVSRDAHKNA